MPASVQADFQGTAASFRNSLSNEALLILAALVAVYIVLGVLYESFIHPITILSTLPSAGVGALLALMVFNQDLSVVAIIGIILLIGIVKKNGIMMVDFALEAEREHGKNATDAIYEACLLRFRPIMMTTMAALLAGIPLALRHRASARSCAAAGYRDGRRTAAEPDADALHHAGDLHLLRQLAQRLSGGRRSPKRQRAGSSQVQAGGWAMNISSPFIKRPVATTLLTVAIAIAGAIAFMVLPGLAAAAGRLPDHLGRREPARRQRGDHGVVDRDAAGAAVRPHRGRDGDDVVEFAGHHRRYAAVRSEPRHRWRGARRGSGHQRGANLSARQPAGNPTYRKVNPADAPIMILALTSKYTIRPSSTTWRPR